MTPPDGPSDLVAAARVAGVGDERVLRAIREVPRAGFVPAEERTRAYLDVPLPIPGGQVTTQPSLVARMVAALALRGGEPVLEVGSGHGWQTALLARLAAQVWSIELDPELARAARENLLRSGFAGARVVVGDGTQGLPEHAPFEAIVISAAHPRVPSPLAEQLAEGGRLVQPIGKGGTDEVVLFRKRDGRLQRSGGVSDAHFVRLLGAHGFGQAE